MRNLLTIAIALIATCVQAQFGGFRTDQPFLAADLSGDAAVNDPAASDALAFWWVANDAAADQGTNATISEWVDRVNSVSLKPLTNTSPKTSSDGLAVEFWHSGINTTRALTNALPITLSSGQGWSVSWIVRHGRYYSGVSHDTLLNGSSTGNREWEYAMNGGLPYIRNGTVLGNFCWNSDFTNSTLHDVMITYEAGSLNVYTNGVADGGGSTANYNFGNRLAVGGSYDGTGYNWTGLVYEVALYTNGLSAVNASNLHYYRTQTYP